MRFQAVFQAGLHTVVGEDNPTNDTKAEWPTALSAAYAVQTEIGWEQILFGRIAQQWDGLAQYCLKGGSEASSGVWTRRAVKLSWQFGLDCWKVCSQMAHGIEGGVLRLEKEQIMEIIKLMYCQVMSVVPRRHKEVLSQTEEEVTSLPYQSQVAWPGHLKYLLPDQYNKVLRNKQGFQTEHTDYDTLRLPYMRGQILQYRYKTGVLLHAIPLQ